MLLAFVCDHVQAFGGKWLFCLHYYTMDRIIITSNQRVIVHEWTLNTNICNNTYLIRIGGVMKKLTITVDDEVYKGLHAHIGRGNISRFLNNMARPHVVDGDIETGYMAMAADEEREQEALAWAEQGVVDLSRDET